MKYNLSEYCIMSIYGLTFLHRLRLTLCGRCEAATLSGQSDKQIVEVTMLRTKIFRLAITTVAAALAATALFACATETVIQTVEVPVERQVEVRVVETVVVEREVAVEGKTCRRDRRC